MLGRKSYAWPAPIAFEFSPTQLPLILLAIGLVSLLIAWRARVVSLEPVMRWPLAVIALLVTIVPFSLHGSYFADYRPPVALPFLLIAAFRVGAVRTRYLAVLAIPAVARCPGIQSLGAACRHRSERVRSDILQHLDGGRTDGTEWRASAP